LTHLNVESFDCFDDDQLGALEASAVRLVARTVPTTEDCALTEPGHLSDRETMESLLSADLRALTAQSDRVGRVFAEMHGLSANEFHALLHIMVGESSGEVLSAGQLQQRIGLTNSAITHLVDRMITAGHIRRDTDPTDRRKVILRYEDHGMAVARSFFARLGAANRRAMADLSDRDLAIAHEVMTTLASSMERFTDELLNEPRQPEGELPESR
jgi:DNA-binding MarR family transcriptional regulator